jgi:TPR repeat protein
VPRNPAQAVKLFRLAAKHGEAGAQFSLGSAYERGSGTTQDQVRAYMWYSLAAASGDSYAARFAQDRDKIASKMTAAQISQARAMAQKCKASNFKSCD